MIENLLHTIKVITSYKGSLDIAGYEKRDVNDSHSESFNVPLKDNNVDHNVSVSTEVDNLNSVIEDEMCCDEIEDEMCCDEIEDEMCCDDPTTDPVLRAINKYKNQYEICNKKVNAGNSIMDNKNVTGIKEHDTSCVIEQRESTSNKEKNVKTPANKPSNNNNKKKIFILGDSMVKNVIKILIIKSVST